MTWQSAAAIHPRQPPPPPPPTPQSGGGGAGVGASAGAEAAVSGGRRGKIAGLAIGGGAATIVGGQKVALTAATGTLESNGKASGVVGVSNEVKASDKYGTAKASSTIRLSATP